MVNYVQLLIVFGILGTTVNAQEIKTNNCPTDVKSLTAQLLQDLPDYANRVIQRTQKLNKGAGVNNYIITAGQAELKPFMMFSRFGDSMKKNPPTPPQETSDGIIGQGVQLWLRDCRAKTQN